MSYISILIFFTAGGCTFLFLAFLQVFFPDMFSNKAEQVPETKEELETTPTIIINTTFNNITTIKTKEVHNYE